MRRLFYLLGSFLALLSAALFFSRAASFWRESATAAQSAPPSGRIVHAVDVDLFIQESGPDSGPAIVFVHGTGAWSELWRQTLDPVAKAGFRAVAVDVPPFGYSGKPLGAPSYTRGAQARRLVALLDALKLQRVSLVAHSVGARPAVEAALQAPDRFDRLVLVDPAMGFASPPAPPQFEQNHPSALVRLFFTAKPLRNAVLAGIATNPLLTKRMFSSFVTRTEAVTAERVRVLQRPFSVRGTTEAQGDWLENLVVSKDDSLGADLANLKKLTMPVLLIWGGADTVTPPWQGERLRDLIPGTKLETITGAGHVPYIEDTDKFNSILLDFLRAPNENKPKK